MNSDKVNKLVVVLLAIFISALFLSMIRSFLMAIFLAGLFSALAYPVYKQMERRLRGRRSLASLITLMLIVLVVLLPLGALTGIITNQAIKVSQSAGPWVLKQINQPGAMSQLLDKVPFYDYIAPHNELILHKAGEMIGSISRFLIDNLSSVTLGAVNFLFMLFILLYTTYFLLIDGEKLLSKILLYLPLQDKDEQLMLDKFTSVARATLKGTAVIGILQGGLAGLAFWIVGIPSAVFWGAIMAVLSIIPSIGTAIIWVPAAFILAFSGAVAKAIGLFIFCALVVGSLDNLLRPILVGKDTQMHELMIFFSTLGGIIMFGIVGMVIGPIIAALFVTIWEIYGQEFKDMLPETASASKKRSEQDDLGDNGSADG